MSWRQSAAPSGSCGGFSMSSIRRGPRIGCGSHPSGGERTKRRIAELFLHGETQGNAPGSKWAALNAIVEYGDWYRPIRQGGDRFGRAVEDGGDKTRTLRLIGAV